MEGETVVTLTGMDRSGAAFATAGEERLVVPGGIPGERVRVRRVRRVGRAAPEGGARRGSVLAEIVAVEEASPNRVVPRCRHAARCGGCAWQHLAYPEQLRRKAAALEVLYVSKHRAQYKSAIELRSSKELHDRLVLVDGDSAWIMGGSIKDAGKMATYLIPLESPIANAKIAIYADIWNRSTQIA